MASITSLQKQVMANKVAKGFNTTDIPFEFMLLTEEVGEAFEAWRKKKPSWIKFTRVPVMWDNDVHRAHARLFYTIEDLGKLDELHPLVFKEIHVNGNMLVAQDPAETEAKQREFLKRFGVTDDQFKKAYHSFNVETNLQRAEQITLRYGVLAVPTFIVNGKYVTDVGMAGGAEKIMPLIDMLAAQEHKH